MTAKILVIVERAYRGSAENRYMDLPYLTRALHRQHGGADVILRGDAVSLAVGGAEPRRSLLALLGDGAKIWADAHDLEAHGLAVGRLVDGVSAADPAALARLWDDYERVWFM